MTDEPQRPEDIRRDEEAEKTYNQHEIDAGRSVVISKVALYALLAATDNYIRRNGFYSNHNKHGKIEIAAAMREGSPLVDMEFDIEHRFHEVVGSLPKRGNKSPVG